MAKSMLLVVSILSALSAVLVKSEGTCDEYGVGDVSECAGGFASTYHIDVTENNVNLHEHHRRQLVYPSISFSCNGTIRKWIVGAEWVGNSDAYTELQIWRRSSGSVYTKVGSTTIMVGTENASRLYEYPLETPLAFQEGDILGYFQPDRDDSELYLYLENSKRLTAYRNDVNQPMGSFDISNADNDDSHYPLITVVTDSPDCGCGFMSLERMNRLLSNQISTEKMSYEEKQLLMPDIQFTCSGEVVKWIMGGKRNHGQHYPELQIWRPSGGTMYQRMSSTTISAAMERDDDVYEFIPDLPIPFQPGDALGVFQPSGDNSRLQMDYDNRGSSVYYYIDTGVDQVVSSHTTFDTTHEDVRTQTALPLVSVEIVAFSVTSQPEIPHSSTPTSILTLVGQQQSITSPPDTYSMTSIQGIPTSVVISQSPQCQMCLASTSVQGMSTSALSVAISHSPPPTGTAALSVAISHSPPPTGNGEDNSDGVSIGVGVSGALLILISAPVIIIALLVCLRKRNEKMKTTRNVAYLHSPTDSHIPQDGSYVLPLLDLRNTTQNDVQNGHTSSSEVADTCIHTFANQAYLNNGPASNTGIVAATNPAYFEEDPIYDDADIPTSTNKSYLKKCCESGSDALTYDYVHT